MNDWIEASPPSGLSLPEFFTAEIGHEDEERKFELIALSGQPALYYGAYRILSKTTGEERVSALVIETKPGTNGGLAYRVVTEYEAPRQHECPKEIYALLTRFRHCEESAQAKAWRDRVESWHRANPI